MDLKDLKNLHKHPTITTAPDVAAIAKPLADKFNINYFQYLSVFEDGRFSLACNRPDWISFAFEHLQSKQKPAVYSHIAGEQLNKSTYCFLWDNNLPDEPVQLAREFDIANGLCFVERYETHYNLIAFATPVSDSSAVETYLNHTPELLHFIQNFKHDKKQLIADINQNAFNVTCQQKDENLDKMLLKYQSKFQAIKVPSHTSESYVTQMEYSCLRYLSQGDTYKAIAQKLGISPRTVESYFVRVKNRLDLSTKSELIRLYHMI